MFGPNMARKSPSSSRSATRPKRAAPATLLVRVKELRDRGGAAGLIALLEQWVIIEWLLVDLADAVDRLDMAGEGARLSLLDRQIRTQLRRAEGRVTNMLLRIEDRIAHTPANTSEQTIVKLMIYGELQGYEFSKSRPRHDVSSIEERLFFSILDDLKRLGPT
jgi:hypothetical protein